MFVKIKKIMLTRVLNYDFSMKKVLHMILLCFYCDEQWHWKCNCPKYLVELIEKKRQNGLIYLFKKLY